MAKGGYHIIDFGGQELTTAGGVTIKGIYESIEGSYNKPLIATGLKINSKEVHDIGVQAYVSSTDFIINVAVDNSNNNYKITIDDDDKVTATAINVLPACTSADSGKVLTVTATGGLAWTTIE